MEVVEGDALAAVERQATLQKALDNIDNIIKEQQKTQDDTRQTIGEPQNLKLPELANKQTDLAKKTDEVKNTALPNQDKVQKALDQATQAMKEAAKTLGEKKPPEAVAKQDKALDALKQACKDLPCGYFFKALVVGNLGPLKFFQIKALRACAKRALSAKGAAISAALRKPEETTKFGKPVVRLPYLCRKLGVSEGTLRGWIARWNERECRWPILTPENPRPVTYEIDGVTHYLKSQVDDEMAVNLEKLPTMIPKNHPTLYSFDTARNFINDKILVSKECREKHNIIVEPFWVRFKYKLRGETVWYLGEINGFTRKSVDAFRVNQVTCKLPPDTISAAAMARNLRSLSKACRVHPRLVNQWCGDGLLDAKRTEHATSSGIRESWVISIESYQAVKELLRKAGWDLAATTRELRNLRLAEPNLAAKRVKAQHLEGEQLATQLAEQQRKDEETARQAPDQQRQMPLPKSQNRNGTPPATVPQEHPAPITNGKNKGGRPPRDDVAEVGKYLYDRWIKGDKLAAIREGAKKKFGADRAPTEDAHVTRDAQRYARKKGLPVTRQK